MTVTKNWVVVTFCAAVLGLLTQNATAAIVAHWAFDEGTGAMTSDSTTNANSATFSSSGPTWNGSGILGGNSLNFTADGNSDHSLTVANSSSLEISGASITLSAWVKNPGAYTPEWCGQIVSKADYNFGFGGGQYLSDKKLWFGFYSEGYRDYTVDNVTLANFADNEWHHLAVTMNAKDASTNTITFFVDGKTVSSQDTAFSLAATATSLRIGTGAAYGGQTYGGDMDDVGIWNSAENAQQIALVNGLGRFAGVNLASSAIDDVLGIFNNASGTATVGSETWAYATGLGSTTIGTIGGSVAAGNAYIVLDSSGNGVRLVPEPTTIVMLLTCIIGFVAYAWRKRK